MASLRGRYLPIALLVGFSLVACSNAPTVEVAQVEPTSTATFIPASTPTAAPTSSSEAPTSTASQAQSTTAQLPSAEEELGLYPIPASCEAMPLVGPEQRRSFPASWLEGNGVVAGTPFGAFFVGSNKVQWQLTTPAPIDISGERLDAQSPPLVVGNTNEFATGTYSSDIQFSAPGCWRLHAQAGAQSLDATIYVYPEVCFQEAIQRVPTPSQKQCAAPS